MRLNVRKRNGVWAVACDDAVLQWFPDTNYSWPWWAATVNCRYRVEYPTATEYELGLR